MKKVILKGLAVALLLTSSVATFAQPQRPAGAQPQQKECTEERPEREKMTPEEMAKKMTEMMKETLELTAAQEKKVYAANLDYAKKLEEARTLKEKHETTLVGILNAEQTVKFFNLRKGGQRGGAQMGGQRGGQKGGQQMGGKRGAQKGEGQKPEEGKRPQGRRPMPEKPAEAPAAEAPAAEAPAAE